MNERRNVRYLDEALYCLIQDEYGAVLTNYVCEVLKSFVKNPVAVDNFVKAVTDNNKKTLSYLNDLNKYHGNYQNVSWWDMLLVLAPSEQYRKDLRTKPHAPGSLDVYAACHILAHGWDHIFKSDLESLNKRSKIWLDELLAERNLLAHKTNDLKISDEDTGEIFNAMIRLSELMADRLGISNTPAHKIEALIEKLTKQREEIERSKSKDVVERVYRNCFRFRHAADRPDDMLYTLEEYAELGDPEANFILAGMYASHYGVSKDFTTYLKYLKNAANLGHSTAMFELADEYMRTGDSDSARIWMERSASCGNTRALIHLHQYFEAAAYDANAQNLWADLIEHRIQPARPQTPYELTDQWRLAAAKNGHSLAQYHVAWLYDVGKFTGIKLPTAFEAVQWYEKSASHGHVGAKYRLANLYMTGVQNVVKQDIHLAIRMYREASNGEHYLARLKLADMYRSGDVEGIEKDSTFADTLHAEAMNLRSNALARFRQFTKPMKMSIEIIHEMAKMDMDILYDLSKACEDEHDYENALNGYVEMKLRRHPDAEAAIKRIITNLSYGNRTLATVYIKRGFTTEASDILRNALDKAKDGDDFEILRNDLINLLLETGKNSEALMLLNEKAQEGDIEATKRLEEIVHMRNREMATFIRDTMQGMASEDIQSAIISGRVAEKSGNILDAMKFYSDVIACKMDDYNVREFKAEAAKRLEDLNKAIAALTKLYSSTELEQK